MESARIIKIIIIDDEPLARQRIRDLLQSEPDMHIVAESGDGLDAHAKIREFEPDIVFLDIKMPGLSGLELGELLKSGVAPSIIFTTAYSEHAVDAFGLDAVDYLMKPFDRQRFREALGKARNRLAAAPRIADVERIVDRLSGLTDHPQQRLAVKDGTHIKFFVLRDITHIQSDGDYLHIHTVTGEHAMIRERMRDMQQRLISSSFVRINRSILVNFDHVREMKPASHGDYELLLSGGARFTSGATYRDTIRGLLARMYPDQ